MPCRYRSRSIGLGGWSRTWCPTSARTCTSSPRKKSKSTAWHQQIAASRSQARQRSGELVKLKNDAACNQVSYEYGGRSYTLSQVKADLANRFERFKTNDATLASLNDIQQARQKSLDAARQKLEGMLAAKRQLEVDVENLDARLKMVEVAQTTSNYSFDDSQLGRAKELMTDLRTRLNVAERMLSVEGDLHDEIPVSARASENIVDQVTEYLSPARQRKVGREIVEDEFAELGSWKSDRRCGNVGPARARPVDGAHCGARLDVKALAPEALRSVLVQPLQLPL